MKYCVHSLLCASLALAQSHGSSTTGLIVPDLNGNRVEAAVYTAKDGDRQELTQSVNGRKVPLQQSETHVLSDGPSGKTTETLTRKYDATGQLVSTERTVVEEKKLPNGAVIHATTYRSDLNGRMAEAERRTIESQTQGPTSSTNVTVSRPGISGSFDVAEKRSVISNADGENAAGDRGGTDPGGKRSAHGSGSPGSPSKVRSTAQPPPPRRVTNPTSPAK